MKNLFKVAAAAATAGALLSGTAGAQNDVHFVGTTTGCFYTGGSSPMDCSGGMTTFHNLTYTGSTFDAYANAADGLFTLGSAPNAPNVNNLGSFRLVDGTYNYTGGQFALFVDFTNPTGVNGNHAYTAMVTGDLTQSTSGNVFVDFDNTGHTFTFADGSSLNNFTVADLSLNDQAGSGVSVAVTGHGFAHGATVTPEPSSMALIGTGLIGLAPVFRRKQKK